MELENGMVRNRPREFNPTVDPDNLPSEIVDRIPDSVAELKDLVRRLGVAVDRIETNYENDRSQKLLDDELVNIETAKEGIGCEVSQLRGWGE